MSQRAFSSHIGMAERTYIRLEAGETDRISIDALAALSRMGVDLRMLVTGEASELAASVQGVVPKWLEPMLPELADLDKSGRDQLVGWIRGYLSALPQKKHAKGTGRSRKAS